MGYLAQLASIIGAAALFAGCGGSQPPIAAPGAMPQSGTSAQDSARGASWILSEAKSEALLYVSDANENTVQVYSYPKGHLVGTLSGFNGLRGLCTDKAGNVYIPNISPSAVFEYAHGGKKPIKTLKDDYGTAFGCAVNLSTNDLAVTTLASGSSFGPGNVLIFRNASGTPTAYTVSSIEYYLFDSYDSQGNLWVDGQTSNLLFALAELPNGRSELQEATVSGAPTYSGNLQWDGKLLDIADGQINNIYRYSVVGSADLTFKDMISLGGTEYDPAIAQFWVRRFGSERIRQHGYRIVGAVRHAGPYSGRVLYWHYPSGGQPIQTITDGLFDPYGVTVSFPGSR